MTKHRLRLALSVTVALGCGVEDTRLTADSVPVWDAAHAAEWTRVRDQQMNVRPHVGEGPEIGFASGDDGTFTPIDGFRHVLIGGLDRFRLNDEPGPENDINLYLLPTASFEFLATQPLFLGVPDPDRRHSCPDVVPPLLNCLEAEVTTDEEAYPLVFDDIYWIGRRSRETHSVATMTGVYGPWVADRKKKNRPEIHPIDIWWVRQQSPTSSTVTYHVAFLQDDSNRFDTPGDFDGPKGESWTPWTRPPRVAMIDLAFEASLTDPYEGQYFAISELVHKGKVMLREVSTGEVDDPLFDDTDTGEQHHLTYGGSMVLLVNESPVMNPAVGVKFVDVRRNAAGTLLRGYVRITARYGANSSGREGFLFFTVTWDRGTGPDDVIPPGESK